MNDCCQDPDNRTPPERLSDDLTLTRCRVCGARHFELDVDEDLLFMEADL